jgi:hypothetical protein
MSGVRAPRAGNSCLIQCSEAFAFPGAKGPPSAWEIPISRSGKNGPAADDTLPKAGPAFYKPRGLLPIQQAKAGYKGIEYFSPFLEIFKDYSGAGYYLSFSLLLDPANHMADVRTFFRTARGFPPELLIKS